MYVLLITAYQITNDDFAPRYIEEAGSLSLCWYINKDRWMFQANYLCCTYMFCLRHEDALLAEVYLSQPLLLVNLDAILSLKSLCACFITPRSHCLLTWVQHGTAWNKLQCERIEPSHTELGPAQQDEVG